MEDPYLTVFNDWLYREWINLPQEIMEKLTHPYLVTPTNEYINSNIRVLVLNKETNGWGEKQRTDRGINMLDIDELKRLYIDKINDNWDNLGSVWPMYIALRGLSEGDNPDSLLQGKIGFIQSNVALIGTKYGNKGFETDIRSLLIEAIKMQIKLLSPNVILLGIGFGTKTKTYQPYVDILTEALLGKIIEIKPCEGCSALFEVKFENQQELTIFGYRHPERLSYKHIVEYVKSYLLRRINDNGNGDIES